MEFEEFKRRIEIIQKAMVKRGISENNNFNGWCNYREPAISRVFQKTIGCNNSAFSWRTSDSLWIREKDNDADELSNDYYNWTFKYHEELTDADIKEFCRIHDIIDLVSPEVYGESKLKLNVVTEVEFMDI